MRDWLTRDGGGAPGTQHLLLAETIGLAMARRAADILDRHRAALTSEPPTVGGSARPRAATSAAAHGDDDDDERFAADNAIFTAVLDATNECLGRFDGRPADERWCDALLQLIQLAQLAQLPAETLPAETLPTPTLPAETLPTPTRSAQTLPCEAS